MYKEEELCCFELLVRGNYKNVSNFIEEVTSEHNMLNAEFNTPDSMFNIKLNLNNEFYYVMLTGECHRTAYECLISEELNEHTLKEMADKYSLDFEIYSQCVSEFTEEHFYYITNGDLVTKKVISEARTYYEIPLDDLSDFETVEDFLYDHYDEDTIAEFCDVFDVSKEGLIDLIESSGSNCKVSAGGFNKWDYVLKDL